jgi:hypothetical protein
LVLTFDEAAEILDEQADRFPRPLFEGLNGGVNLLEEERPDPEFKEGLLYTMGEYCCDSMGRYINLYYGSFAALARQEDWSRETWEKRLYSTLSHELTHHMEGRAGTDALDRRDAEEREHFRKKYRRYRREDS